MTWVTHERPTPATLLYRLLAVRWDYGGAVRRLKTIRAELAAIQRLRERGIDAVASRAASAPGAPTACRQNHSTTEK